MAMHVKHYVPYFIRPLLTAIVTHMNELLCNINDISDPGAKGFEISFNESTLAFLQSLLELRLAENALVTDPK